MEEREPVENRSDETNPFHFFRSSNLGIVCVVTEGLREILEGLLTKPEADFVSITIFNFEYFLISEHHASIYHVDENTVLQEEHCNLGNGSSQSGRFLVKAYEQVLVDQVSDCVENSSNKVENGHPTAVEQDHEKCRHHPRVCLFSLEHFAGVNSLQV